MRDEDVVMGKVIITHVMKPDGEAVYTTVEGSAHGNQILFLGLLHFAAMHTPMSAREDDQGEG